MTRRILLSAILIPTLFTLAGCWNGDVSNLRMGDVSIGQQLIDLKRAREEEAIDELEYQNLRKAIMSLAEVCGNGAKDESEG